MRTALAPNLPRQASIGLFFLRLVAGVGLVAHGEPKIAHPTAWMGSRPLVMPITHAALLIVPPWLQAVVAGVEFFGGIALVVGLLTRLAAFALCADMIVAILFSEIPRGTPFVARGHTLEPALMYLAASFLLLLAGPGEISLDDAFANRNDGAVDLRFRHGRRDHERASRHHEDAAI